ncbi:PREDICTED: uncharacterized protein LOC109339150 [Lupinus angustifolius]|uniref:uncharacterized protein LOC109339150 n=1 Tax=Lupinus angustifolius TaxID=3871 RepID=UPI00092FC8A7|nr:PREDICTED: uncharacterized protein LOC109339150 [Lupinus angustifolius]
MDNFIVSLSRKEKKILGSLDSVLKDKLYVDSLSTVVAEGHNQLEDLEEGEMKGVDSIYVVPESILPIYPFIIVSEGKEALSALPGQKGVENEERRSWRLVIVLFVRVFGETLSLIGNALTLDSSERKDGSGVNSLKEIQEFDKWISDMEFLDLPLIGRKFSRFQPGGDCMSRLDRFLKGPYPFKFNNAWIPQEGLAEVISKAWSKPMDGRWYAFTLKEKLKRVKAYLKQWSKERKKLQVDWWNVARVKDSLLSQKAKCKWLKDGVANSSYFHACVNVRRRINHILGISINGCWYDDSAESDQSCSPKLDGVDFQNISTEQGLSISGIFTTEDIKKAVWSFATNKSPSPDGFNFKFYQEFWDTIKEDICLFMKEFQVNSKLPKGLKSSFIAFIPKIGNPSKIQDYRPISLVSSLYKIVAKVLAERLKSVMNSIISPAQSAFLGGHNILDAPIILNEVIHSAKKSSEGCFIMKVDFQKAYDSVNWIFIDYMLHRFGFPSIWRRWIKECITYTSKSILVNGIPSQQFSISKGIRQGDPLAPFLFLMVVEGFTGMVRRALSTCLYAGFKVGRSQIEISVLQFADDTMLVRKPDSSFIWTIKSILRCFDLVSRLKVNFHKSSLMGINVHDNVIEAAATFLSCKVGSNPFNYLGIPVGANPRRFNTWTPVSVIVASRLANWKIKHVSFSGRLILINSVLNSIPIYMLSLYKAPKKVIPKLVNMQRSFMWGNKGGTRGIMWIAWDTIYKPKKNGGLGVKNLAIFNKALLCKWKWRRLKEPISLWVSILNSKYGTGLDLLHSSGDFVWWKYLGSLSRDLDCVGADFEQNVSKVIGDGNSTRFWLECWCGNQSLRQLYPRLYMLAANKNVPVADCGYWSDNTWSWRIKWRRGLLEREKNQEGVLLAELRHFSCCMSAIDDWRLGLDLSGMYVVKITYLEAMSIISTMSDANLARNSQLNNLLNRGWNSKAHLKF